MAIVLAVTTTRSARSRSIRRANPGRSRHGERHRVIVNIAQRFSARPSRGPCIHPERRSAFIANGQQMAGYYYAGTGLLTGRLEW